jgi:hypothetical protein
VSAVATVVCLVCRLDFDGQPDAAHAAYFAGVHDDLHHASVPTAFTTMDAATVPPVPVGTVVAAIPRGGKAAPGPWTAGPRGPWGGDAA